MTVSPPARRRLGRALTDARKRRDRRRHQGVVRAQLATYRTTAELAELSAIASRNEGADTGELRRVLSHQLSR